MSRRRKSKTDPGRSEREHDRSSGTVRGNELTIQNDGCANIDRAAHDRETSKTDRASVSRGARPAPAGRGRLWLFRAAALVLIPAVFFGTTELGLRLFGFGVDTGYFARLPDGGAAVGNPFFGWRFFPPAIARVPGVFRIEDPKPAGTVRLFVLGSSAAQGFPDPSFSFSRFLDVMLHRIYPGRRFEVINTAMVAINSHVLVPIARDCAEHEPDLFIVYEGNNEVVGPFGPGTVFGRFSTSLGMTRAMVALRGLRVSQMVQRGMASLVGGGETMWRGMEFFLGNQIAADDPRLDAAREQFARNLGDICDAARGTGAEVLLCTVGVNLRECAPFASLHRSDLAEADAAKWKALYDEGVKREDAGDARGAADLFMQASKIDDAYADLHFRLGRCRRAMGDGDGAREAFARARDLDSLRFRTDSRFNATIRDTAKGREGVRLIDVEAAMNAEAAAGGPGRDLFYEHCHMNLRGNYLIAREIVTVWTPSWSDAPRGPLPTFEECLADLAYGESDRCAIAKEVASLIEQPPFVNQLDHAQQRASARADVAACAAEDGAALEQARQATATALTRRPNDRLLVKKLAGLELKLGDATGAEKRLRGVLDEYPHDLTTTAELGAALLQQKRAADALRAFETILASPFCDPASAAEAHFNIGVVRDALGEKDAAVRAYEQTLALKPGHIKAHTNLGLVLSREGRLDEAAAHHRAVISAQPDLALARINLALVFFRQQKWAEAASELETALRHQPRDVTAMLLLGEALVQARRFDEGIARLRAALELAPRAAEAHNALGSALLRAGRAKEAVPHLETALRLKPGYATAEANLKAARQAGG
ncbi:MAG: hypothetical protein HBSAPP02_06050 [Phycisphaerae bacterium]|nr:MAG: tetratricopeptide repeat protein [Planctomycetia bacterium]RIK68657.1 MAG: hypothetical protein DCC66_09920 [Planctomycetota bacterium]GJQ25573.1 MAG: hypothetical protein HBSAPP02_06050 [Phycisphaerae bacterium]